MASYLDRWEPVIGLEVHAQLMTKSKMFCSCPNHYGSGPNTNICEVCTGQPGSLPVINQKAIELGIRAALAVNGAISEDSVFARKNYFYPDLPKGYQISQFESPYCVGGSVLIQLENEVARRIPLTRIHFEEDAGKLIHQGDKTLVDLNRAGVPLIEIVSEPEIRSPLEAGEYLRKLHAVLRYANICDGNMEQGSFRCDANVSVRPRGEKKLGTRTELKNINSFRFVEKAIQFEIERQIDLLEAGEKVVQETRLWDSDRNVSEPMRGKEDAHDYRYFPEPDLPILVISEKWIQEVREAMPELPDQQRERFVQEYELSEYDAGFLTGSRELASYFESVAKLSQDAKLSANWIMNELMGRLNATGRDILHTPVKSESLAKLLSFLVSDQINGKIAKTVFDEMFEKGTDPGKIIEARGLVQISDPSALEPVVQKVIEAHPDQVASFREGNTKLLGFFVGQVMKETKGQGNPKTVNQLVKQLLQP